ncbi:DUF6912 family protein [Angustibacter sp. McL0619]|uniref:DUF6912 family protein n=1 Tax=Angustibacter sp. McL0619 TaxID=3415676 RepID=UPI003CEAB069
MRVYLPATLGSLSALRDNGFQPPLPAHAVTGELREWYADGDADELEYAAGDEAAHASLRLLADDDGQARRRVVVAADVPDSAVSTGGSYRSSVVVTAAVDRGWVASVHVDGAEARTDVSQAVRALAAADDGDDDAQFTVDQAAGHELLWYDVSELDDVLALARDDA